MPEYPILAVRRLPWWKIECRYRVETETQYHYFWTRRGAERFMDPRSDWQNINPNS